MEQELGSPTWCSRAHAKPSLRFTKGPHRGLERTQALSSVGALLPRGPVSPGSARLTSPALRAHFIPSGALRQPMSFQGERCVQGVTELLQQKSGLQFRNKMRKWASSLGLKCERP